MGGSQTSAVGQSATNSISQISRENFNGLSQIFEMKVKRTFSMPILTNGGGSLFVIGGTAEPKIDLYDLEKKTPHSAKVVQQLEEYLFFELGNYSTDFTLSSCAFA